MIDHLNIVKKSFTIVLILIMNCYVLLSQINCPENTSEPWSNSEVEYDMGQYGPGGNVDFQYRTLNGEKQIKVDWTSFQNMSDFVPTDAMKKILEIEAVKALVPNLQGPYQIDIYVYYLKPCFARVKTAIHLTETNQKACCDDESIIGEDDIKEKDGDYYYNVHQLVSCGYKCCARVYRATREYDDLNAEWYTSVTLLSTQTITSCSGNPNLIDCITLQPIPCIDGSCDGF